MKKKWKMILGAVVVVVLVIVMILQNAKPLQASLLEIKQQNIAKTFKEESLVTADLEYPISTLYGGRIQSIAVQEGQQVKQGELLVQIDYQELQFLLDQLQGQIKSVEAQKYLQDSSIGLDNLQKLYELGAISKKEYEDAKNTVESNFYPGQIEALVAQMNSVQHKISESNFYAPLDGVISSLDVKEGMILNPGERIMTVFGNQAYKLETFVLSEDIPNLRLGEAVKLTQNNKNGDIIFSGVIDKIAPSAVEKMSALGLTEQRVKVSILPKIPEKLELKPGYAIDVEFTVSSQENKLIVPKTVIFPYENGEALWVVRNGKAVIQPIQKGFDNDRDVVIEEGLQVGDLVILDTQLDGLKEGKKVIKI